MRRKSFVKYKIAPSVNSPSAALNTPAPLVSGTGLSLNSVNSVLQTHGARMHPKQIWAHRKHFFEKRERTRPIEQHSCVNSGLFKNRSRVSGDDIHVRELPLQYRKLRLGRLSGTDQDQNFVVSHRFRENRARDYTTILANRIQ